MVLFSIRVPPTGKKQELGLNTYNHQQLWGRNV